MFRHAILLLCLALAGCSTPAERGIALTEQAGWRWDVLPAGPFDLASASNQKSGKTLWLYIEGDGRAFLSPARASSDPTPTDPVALRMALAQPGEVPVAYLARPCQYVLPLYGRNCDARYWTNARYAPEVIASLNMAADHLKTKAGATHLILIGYSGGGALAVLMGAKRKDVSGIITVAANLDLNYWTKRDELVPLTGSLDPADAAEAIAYIPQFHFTGSEDTVVGTDVVRSYLAHLPRTASARAIEIPGFTHACCWAKQWPILLQQVNFSDGF